MALAALTLMMPVPISANTETTRTETLGDIDNKINALLNDALPKKNVKVEDNGLTASENGWNYAKWGMTKAELIAASNGNAIPTVDKKSQRIFKTRRYAIAEKKLGHVPINVNFHFTKKPEKLVMVRYVPTDTNFDCPAFEKSILQLLGKKEGEKKSIDLSPNRPPLIMNSFAWDEREKNGNIYRMLDVSFGKVTVNLCHLLISDPAFDDQRIKK